MTHNPKKDSTKKEKKISTKKKEKAMDPETHVHRRSTSKKKIRRPLRDRANPTRGTLLDLRGNVENIQSKSQFAVD